MIYFLCFILFFAGAMFGFFLHALLSVGKMSNPENSMQAIRQEIKTVARENFNLRKHNAHLKFLVEKSREKEEANND